MRPSIAVILISIFGAGCVEASDLPPSAKAALHYLPDSEQTSAFSYDADSLTATMEFGIGRGRISFSIANAFELPELELPKGSYVDETVVLTEELNPFEVDTGDGRMFSLMFSFDW